MGANDIAAVMHTSGRTDAAQEFTSNKALLHAAIDKFVGRRMRSLTIERLDSYYQRLSHALPGPDARGTTARRRRPVDRSRRPQQDGARPTSSAAIRAVGVLDTLKQTAEFLSSRSRTPQGRPLLQRRDRLSHHRLVRRPQRHRRHSRHAGCHHDGRARERQLLHDRSARAGRHDQRVHGDGRAAARPSWRVPRQCARQARMPRSPASLGGTGGPFNAQTELMAELMLSQGSLRELAEQTGGIASVNTNSLTSRSTASCRPTAATTCSATTPRRIRAMAGSTKSKSR